MVSFLARSTSVKEEQGLEGDYRDALRMMPITATQRYRQFFRLTRLPTPVRTNLPGTSIQFTPDYFSFTWK